MKIHKLLFLTILIVTVVTIFSPVYAIENEKIDQTEYHNIENEKDGNGNFVDFLSCGEVDGKDALIEDIPQSIPKTIHIIYLIIQIAIPVVLVVFGSLDLFKGLYAQKEEEIKKGQQIFVKRLIAAAIIFLVFMVVKLFVGIVADSNKSQIIDCAECFIENNCD